MCMNLLLVKIIEFVIKYYLEIYFFLLRHYLETGMAFYITMEYVQ